MFYKKTALLLDDNSKSTQIKVLFSNKEAPLRKFLQDDLNIHTVEDLVNLNVTHAKMLGERRLKKIQDMLSTYLGYEIIFEW